MGIAAAIFGVIGGFFIYQSFALSNGNCANICEAVQQWNGNVHGASTTMVVSSSGGGTCTNKGSYCVIARELEMSGSSDIAAGYLWCVAASGGACPSGYTANVPYYYYQNVYNSSKLIRVPSGDINKPADIQLNYLASAPGSMAVWIHGASGYTCMGNSSTNQCIIRGVSQTYPYIKLDAFEQGTFTGKLGWTTTMTNNRWQATSGQWHFQTSNGYIIRSDNPPWIGWSQNLRPSNTIYGGKLYNCIAVSNTNPC